MTESTQPIQPTVKGNGKGGVVALSVLVVILVVSNILVYMSMQNQISALNTDKTNLQNQINALRAPKIIKVDLKTSETYGWNPVLHVYGYLCNVGDNTAYNCWLHVVGYLSNGVVASDTHISLAAISGGSWVLVDIPISLSYSGSSNIYNPTRLTNVTITEEWTSQP